MIRALMASKGIPRDVISRSSTSYNRYHHWPREKLTVPAVSPTPKRLLLRSYQSWKICSHRATSSAASTQAGQKGLKKSKFNSEDAGELKWGRDFKEPRSSFIEGLRSYYYQDNTRVPSLTQAVWRLRDLLAEEDRKTPSVMMDIILAYGEIPHIQTLHAIDIEALAHTVRDFHWHFRGERRYVLLRLANFVTLLRTNLMRGEVAYSTGAITKLIHYCIDAENVREGMALWEWARTKSKENKTDGRSHDLYGAAISLLLSTKSPLRLLEEIFEEAGSHFGVLPKIRSGSCLNKGVPARFEYDKRLGVVLPRAICQARLHYNDWRAAYLYASSAFQTGPSTQRDEVLYAFVMRRPLTESYSLLHLFFRMGSMPPVPAVMVIKGLCAAQRFEPSHAKDAVVVVGVLRVLHDFISYGGKVSSTAIVNNVFGCLLALLPHRDSAADDSKPSGYCNGETPTFMAKVDALVTCVKFFLRNGFLAGPEMYRSFLYWGGRLRQSYLVNCGWSGLKDLDYKLALCDYRELMRAYGLLQDAESLRLIWFTIQDIVKDAKMSSPGFADWACMILASKRANVLDFAHHQVKSNISQQNRTEPNLYGANVALLGASLIEGEDDAVCTPFFRHNWMNLIDESLQRLYNIARIATEGKQPDWSPQMQSWESIPAIPEAWSKRLYATYNVPENQNSSHPTQLLPTHDRAMTPYEIWKYFNNLLVRAYCDELRNPSKSDKFPPKIPWSELVRPRDGRKRIPFREVEQFAARQLEEHMDMVRGNDLRFNEAEWRKWIGYLRRPPDESRDPSQVREN